MLTQLIIDALAEVQEMLLSQTQKDKMVARKLQWKLFELKETSTLHSHLSETVNGTPFVNWLLSNELLHCASTFMETASTQGFSYFLHDSLQHDIFYTLTESKQYRLLLKIIQHLSTEQIDLVKICAPKSNFSAAKLLLNQFRPTLLTNKYYLELLIKILSNTPLFDLSLSNLLSIHHALVAEEKKCLTKIDSSLTKITQHLALTKKIKQIFLENPDVEKENSPSKTQASPIKDTVEARKETHLNSIIDLKHKAEQTIAELTDLKCQLEKEKIAESSALTEEEQTRRRLIHTCTSSIERLLSSEDCSELEKKYEKAALSLRKMR